ncbi:MAG: N-acetylneuraminate synthase family protein [Methanoregula sp.]
MSKTITIGKKTIGEGFPAYIIAEIGINHNGDINTIKKMVLEAKFCGVDAVKFQIFKSEEFISNSDYIYSYTSQGKPVSESMLAMFRRFEFSANQWKTLFRFCTKQGIDFFVTPQNPSDLDFVLSLVNIPVIKVGSDDLTNLDLLDNYARRGKPLIISAGMATISEIEDAVTTIRNTGNNDFAILHCISSYPCEAQDVHLKKMLTIRQTFDVVTGFSDHTVGSVASVGAVTLGAHIIEKHFTLDKNLPGPDHWFSADPRELKELVCNIRFIEDALGTALVQPTQKEYAMREIARRSIVAIDDIPVGKIIQRNMVGFKRPGIGLPPKYLNIILGRKTRLFIRKNEQITFNNT